MFVAKRRFVAVAIGLLLIACTALAWWSFAPRTNRAAGPEIDPKAMAQLSRATNYMRSLPAFSLSADVTQDEVVQDDFKLQRTSQVRIAVRRPDRMRAEVYGDLGNRLFVYDGKTLSVYLEKERYFITQPAPATLKETLDAALEKHALELPLADILYVAMGGELQSSVRDAGEIGSSMIDGTACLHLAFRGAKVDWQLWVQQGTQPLPRKIVITTTDAPTRPQYNARLSWDLSSPIPEDRFQFTPPKGAMPIAAGVLPAEPARDQAPKSKDKPKRD